MATLTWLHLSDWHQKGKDFGRDVVCDALMKDIKNRKETDGSLEKIDFVVFSGDVAYHGKAEEYQAAIAKFFDPLLEAAGIERDRLIIVPGNHDLERAALDMLPGDLLEKLTTPTAINEWLTDERKRHTLLMPMENYSKFVIDYLGKDLAGTEPAYGNIRRFDAGGKKIAVIGLNSAWLCARHKEIRNGKEEVNDSGYLLVGEPQVYEALEKSVDADVRIAVLHHPFDWLTTTETLAEKSIIRGRLSKECHFILHGHEHEPNMSVPQGTVGNGIVVSAGSSYDRREPTASRYANGYSFVHLDLTTWQGTVYLRRYEDRQGWIRDTATTGDKTPGYCVFSLPLTGGVVSEDGTDAVDEQTILPPRDQFEWRRLNLENPNQIVTLRDKLYVRREADDELDRQVEYPGTVTTIRAPYQTGKSSLLVRGVRHALETGARVVMFDLQMVDNTHLESSESFLKCMAESIVMRLGLDLNRVTEIWDRKWYPQNKLTYLMENYVLPGSENRLVLAMDEVDRLLATSFRDDFFRMLRAWCNSTAYQEPWDRLSIVMAIATDPWLFIQDVRQSPFNVGLKLKLEDFSKKQVQYLNQQHGNPVGEKDLPKLVELLNGHPYLTRQALYTLVQDQLTWGELDSVAVRDEGPFGEHLGYYYYGLLHDQPNLRKALVPIISHDRCPDEDAFYRLQKAGLLKGTVTACEWRCDLYRKYFKDKLR